MILTPSKPISLTLRRVFSLITAAVLLLSLTFTSFAAPIVSLGSGKDFYICDNVGVIGKKDAEHIKSLNEALFALTGAELVTVTVTTTSGEDISKCAAEIFKSEHIGSRERDNGMLLLLATADSNYWFIKGNGLDELLPSEDVKALLAEHLEPSFALGDYSRGISEFADAVASELAVRYGVILSSWDKESYGFTKNEESFSDSFVGKLFAVLLVIALVILVGVILVILALALRSHISAKRRRTIKRSRRHADSSALRFANNVNSRRPPQRTAPPRMAPQPPRQGGYPQNRPPYRGAPTQGNRPGRPNQR